MINILFVCHGNICRSPMAEFIMKDLVKKAGVIDDFNISSAATSSEEIGNTIYYSAQNELKKRGIAFEKRYARKLTSDDYFKYDYIIGMEQRNIYNMLKIFKNDNLNKIHLLLDFTDFPHDIEDPWYSGNFSTVFDEIYSGCSALLKKILLEKA